MTKRKRKRRKQARQLEETPARLWIHGLACIGDERWEEAITTFQKLLKTEVDAETRASIYSNLSPCYRELGRFDEALAALDEVEKHTGEIPSLFFSRGMIYACMEQIEDAITAIETLRRRWPRQSRQFEPRAMLKQLRCIARGERPPGDYWVDYLQAQVESDVEFGDYARVEGKARRMIAANPARPEGHFALGLACVELQRCAEAQEAFLASHERDPDYVPTYVNLALAYIRAEEPAQAIPWLERALAKEPHHLAALYQMGVAHQQLDQREEALAWWRRAQTESPEDQAVQERLHEMGEGPAPVEPPLPPKYQQMARLAPVVKARIQRPRVCRNGGVTLTYDRSGFVLEDKENPRNASVYAGGPFGIREMPNRERGDLLDMLGLFKMTLRMVDVTNTRSVAVLTYYRDRPMFGYQARFEWGKIVDFDADGQFVVTEVPRLFKMNIDSDLETPYGNPMQGLVIYLSQTGKPDVLISTLPQGA